MYAIAKFHDSNLSQSEVRVRGGVNFVYPIRKRGPKSPPGLPVVGKIDIKQEFGGDLSVCMLSILSKASTLATLLAINLTKVEM